MAELRNASLTPGEGKRHTLDGTKLHVTSVLAQKGEHAVLDHITDADEEILGALGYKQEFKRYARRYFFLLTKSFTTRFTVHSLSSRSSLQESGLEK